MFLLLELETKLRLPDGPTHSHFQRSCAKPTSVCFWAGRRPRRFRLPAAQAATGVFEADFVETQGYLQHIHYESGNTIILDLDDGSQSFRAIVTGGPSAALYRKFSEQSLLRVRGICVLESAIHSKRIPFALLSSRRGRYRCAGWSAMVECPALHRVDLRYYCYSS